MLKRLFAFSQPRQILVAEEHYRPLAYVDAIFGSYIVILTLLAGLAWLRGEGSLRSVLVFLTFLAANGLISAFSRRAQKPLGLELVRALAGAMIAPAAYLFTEAPFSHWWPGFLIMCLGGNIILGLMTGSPGWGRLLTLYYLGLLWLAEYLGTAHMQWYSFVINAGAIGMVGLLFAELVSLLGRKLEAERQQMDQALRAIVEGVGMTTGSDFLRSLVKHLASTLGVRYALITENIDSPATRMRTLAFWAGADFNPNLEYNLAGTPCERVVAAGETVYHSQSIQTLFPKDTILVDLHAESYMGMPLYDEAGQILGHLAVLDDKPMGDETRRKSILRIFAARAGAEIARQRAEDKLRASEEHFRSLIENSADAIAIADTEGRLTYVSPAYKRLLGYEPEELIGQAFLSLVHPDDLPHIVPHAAQVLAEPDKTHVTEVRIRHKDGSWRVWENVARVLSSGYTIGNNRDITERKQAEEKLRHLNEALEQRVAERTAQLESAFAERTRLAEILEATSDLVAFATLDGRPLYLNRAGRNLMGLADEVDVSTLTFADFYPPEALELFSTVGIPTALREGTWSSEVTIKHRNGHLIPVSLVGILHRAPDGAPSHLSAIARDISERKLAEAVLRESEERYRAVSELTSNYVYSALVDPQGHLYLEWATEAFGELTGYDTAELRAQGGWSALIHPDDMTIFSGRRARLLAGHSDVSEYRILTKAGENRWLRDYAKPELNEQRQVARILGAAQDITDRKRAEEELQTALLESRRLAAIIEATPDYVGIADLQGWSLYVNQAGQRMVGKPAAHYAKPWNVAGCYPEHVLPQIGEMMETVLRGEAWSGELALLHYDGRQFPIEEVTFPLRDANGNIEAVATFIRDISEKKQAQAELERAKEAAEAANKAKSTFLANMSHEIRTPMNAVIGMTGLLLNTPLSPKQQDFVETIRTAGDSLLTIINDILDFSKIEADKLELEKQPFDLRACVESALDLVAPHTAQKRLDLAYVIEPHVPAGITGDVTRLRQILVNLLSNAIKFTEAGEVVVSVTTTDHRPPTAISSTTGASGQIYELHISVRDTGIGIAPERMGRLFQSFSQLDASTTRQFGGTGLGLAISKRLAELMGGAMWAESEGLDRGATFHFTLQAEAAAVPERRYLHEPRPELSGKRILIVDDNPTNRRILYLQLQSWGMLAYPAATPAEALAAFERGECFDVAILDMHMPEMDGLLLAETIGRVNTTCPGQTELPLIMLTSVGHAAVELESPANFAAFLTKPVKPSQLYDALVSVLAEGYVPPEHPAPQPGQERLLAEQLPLRILLVEDVAVNQKFALLALEEMGYRADVAGNGLEALAAVVRQPYDAILMDVQMPEMDGLEATRRIHQIWESDGLLELPISQRPYIIAMTANALQGDREMCLEAGMDDYISKPIYLNELHAALERAGINKTTAQPPAAMAVNGQQNGRALLAAPPAAGSIEPETLAQLLKLPNGPQIISLYLAEAGELLVALQTAVAQNDAPAVREAAHSLKGGSSYLGAKSLAGLSGALEQQGRDGNLTHAADLLAQIAAEFERVSDTLKTI